MKVKNERIWGVLAARESLKQLRPSVGTAYRIGKRLTVLDAEIRQIEQMRQELLDKHDCRDIEMKISAAREAKEESRVNTLSKKLDRFMKDFEELMDVEVDLDLEPIKLSDIEQGGAIDAGSLMAFDWLILDDSLENGARPTSSRAERRRAAKAAVKAAST